MRVRMLKQVLVFCLFLFVLGITACKTSTGPTGAANAPNRNLPPQNVDVRGSIIMTRYNQGQVMIEVESITTQGSRYNRAYVLVVPITQIVGPDGRSISLSELRQGQNVAILLRGGGRGNLVGLGVARKMWVQEGL